MIGKSYVLFLAILGLTLAILPSTRETPQLVEPPRVSAAATEANPENDFAAHVERLKQKLPSDDFSIVIQPPFVVVGDESADVLKEHSERTVKWAVDKLKQDYFTK